ncbi:hypothetical protein GS4_08_00190 [Gordonia soli NBRC 108243]|uniref:4-aminobutyrate aminotransferase n=1 Tax=Gordonia soli NBRC 108243 TaxID=1223545 RepID=M0QFQ7_9ACTN|nr:hypothetical protein GS4_08_00190 [Gordonia soli NBRC 108243]
MEFALADFDHSLRTVTSPDQVAAVFVEPILGEGGCVPAPAGFLAGLRDRADAHGFLLVFDEVQTGFGRTGRFWAHQHDEVRPDVLVAAKGMTGGLPLSVMAASDELMRQGHQGSQGGTFNGNVLACAAAIATLEVIESEQLVQNADRRGVQLMDGLQQIAASRDGFSDVRGRGLMVGCELTLDDHPDPARAAAIQQNCLDSGLMVQRGGPARNVLRLLPALTVSADEVDTALDIIDDAAAGAPSDRELEHSGANR